MRMAIMQPYFFPYIGQFQLIGAVDRYVLCDDVQYIRHGWINRNRILKQGEGVQYIILPVCKHKSHTPIRDIKVVDGNEWKTAIFRQIELYKKKAPWYEQVSTLLCTVLSSTNEQNITRLNGLCLKAVCDYIGVNFKIEISSTLNLDYSNISATQDWAIHICKQLGASEYLNPPGGVSLYNKEEFARHNIGLHFVKPRLREYDQGRKQFEPGLSIIDVMMFNSPYDIKDMLTDYELL
jgi:hypothetical protein